MSDNKKFKKKDLALGGKIHCEGCGADWWVSGPQAFDHDKNGWPIKCGNHPDVMVPGSRNDCTHVGEMQFIPYDIDENIAEFRKHGLHEVADGIRKAAERIIADIDKPKVEPLPSLPPQPVEAQAAETIVPIEEGSDT